MAVLEVEDTGEGIVTDNLERIFDPVFTTRGAGRGLGLGSVLGIVRGHGGAVHVRSELGDGARFTLVFPLVDAPVEAVPVPPMPDLEGRTGSVLVVAEHGRTQFLPKPYTLAALEDAIDELLRTTRKVPTS